MTGWMVVSEDRREAVAGWFRMLAGPNQPYTRMRLAAWIRILCTMSRAAGDRETIRAVRRG